MTNKELFDINSLQKLIKQLKKERDLIKKCAGFNIIAEHIGCYDPNGILISLENKKAIYKKILINGLNKRIIALEAEFKNL